MISVQVIHQSSGRPYSSRRVALGFSGFFGGVTRAEWSDSRGEAHFDCNPKSGCVYVDGDEVWSGYLEGRIVVYVR